MRHHLLSLALPLLSIVLTPLAARAQGKVELEIITDASAPITAQQEWLALLKDLDLASLRLRSARAGDVVEIKKRGRDAAPVYHVTGILARGNRLIVPGGSFRYGDKGGIRAWLDKVQSGGEAALVARPAAFGLSGEALVEVHEGLSVPVSFATRGASPKDVVRKIARGIRLSLVVDPAVRGRFEGGLNVDDELRGVSSGTALAAVVRPLGLVLVPRKAGGGNVELRITDSRSAPQSWPIGWPPEKKERLVLPKLFAFLPVEINDISLPEAMEAIAGRLETPLLYDYNSLARQRIEPATVRVSLPSTKTYYKKVLDRLLFQAKMKAELRVDEAGKPLLWISTIKQ